MVEHAGRHRIAHTGSQHDDGPVSRCHEVAVDGRCQTRRLQDRPYHADGIVEVLQLRTNARGKLERLRQEGAGPTPRELACLRGTAAGAGGMLQDLPDQVLLRIERPVRVGEPLGRRAAGRSGEVAA